MSYQPTKGKVILAAAGPGDPELVTLKTVRFLQQADVVLADRLVSEDIIKAHVKPGAEVIYVGKQCRRGISTPQLTINELLVHHAGRNQLVVRLKGGDTGIFSNILDELETLVAYQIPYEIVPGVTAALGASAYAGIPLTARGYATSVRFLTYYKSDVVTDKEWKELAETNDTLVWYMSSETLDTVVEKLTQHQISADKLLAVAEQATTPLQNIHTCSLYDYERQLKGMVFLSPSLVIIGKVVALHEQFAWIANSYSKEHYFKPLTGRVSTIHDGAAKDNKHVNRA
ncbi:uroporphyrin-III C-methyltransferase / precorrin-2 dehydrogenase / sirohydrochlorin ferrochelatase/uroporphyrin-III C-methyltransferase [Hydrobacter penzbergensis]|uniref:uroporphyrinogen-III C-methyltransferase n=1 Tax=Hydrobacter penzbergensis TaxID=1235997 RepID=A0A8X8IHC1_9BACT|nr:uroporphyrinogen-III C-methyltransferase [Hydrobacter penzbergensis]SDX36120.1 uroporphyrin-III C-methyltransferase / precorrin-2 dehydrogenase / sirohydrochlorin ferrochelatase/uroporphyrin-III C-methyltransferase [Hydrobacter penzbergensis]